MKSIFGHVFGGAIVLLSLAVSSQPLQAAVRGASAAMRATPAPARQCKQSSGRQEVGFVRSGSNGLQVRHGNGKSQQIQAGKPIHAGDALQTKKGDRAGVDLCDGSVLFINQGSDVVVPSRNQIDAKRGQAAEFLKQGTNHKLTASTGAANGRDTSFGVTVSRKESRFVVLQGTLRVSNRFGSVTVKRDRASAVPRNRAPQKPVKVDAQAALTWTTPLAWQVLTAPDLLSEPRRVAVDRQGNLYVTDQYHNRILKLSPTGAVLAGWGSPGSGPGDASGGFPEPTGITLDPAGNIYVADAVSQIKKLSPSGHLLLSWGNCGYPDCTDPNDPRILNGPWSVTLDGAGNVYVADSAHDRLVKYAPDGHPLATFGVSTPSGQVPTADPGVLNDPQGVAVDSAGNVYAADTLNNRIQKFSASGQPLAQWGSRGAALGQFYEPTDLTIDSHGNIYVADSGNNRIEELNSGGKANATYDTNSIPKIGGFVSPEGVALDAQGNMYVVDRSVGRLWKYSRPG